MQAAQNEKKSVFTHIKCYEGDLPDPHRFVDFGDLSAEEKKELAHQIGEAHSERAHQIEAKIAHKTRLDPPILPIKMEKEKKEPKKPDILSKDHVSSTGSPVETRSTPYSTALLGPAPWGKEECTRENTQLCLCQPQQKADEYTMNDGYTTEDSTVTPGTDDEQILDEELYEPATVPFEESCSFWDQIPLAHIVTTYANTTCHIPKSCMSSIQELKGEIFTEIER